jgi:hypothetical protein
MTSLRLLMSRNSLVLIPWIEVVTSSTNVGVLTMGHLGRRKKI